MLSYQKGEEPGMLYTNSCEVLRATSVGHEFSGSPALTGHGQNGFWRPEKTLRQINAGVGSEKLWADMHQSGHGQGLSLRFQQIPLHLWQWVTVSNTKTTTKVIWIKMGLIPLIRYILLLPGESELSL